MAIVFRRVCKIGGEQYVPGDKVPDGFDAKKYGHLVCKDSEIKAPAKKPKKAPQKALGSKAFSKPAE